MSYIGTYRTSYVSTANTVVFGPWIHQNVQQASSNLTITLGDNGTTDSIIVGRNCAISGIFAHVDNGPIVTGSITVFPRINHISLPNSCIVSEGQIGNFVLFSPDQIGVSAGQHIGVAITSSNPLTPNNTIHIAVFLEVTMF